MPLTSMTTTIGRVTSCWCITLLVGTAGYGSAKTTTGSTSDETHWAFVAPRKPEIPKQSSEDRSFHSIDRFVRRQLDARGLHPSPRASRETLIRRLSFDLTGLPPEPSDVKAFVDDTRPNAYGLLVDRLLASKHYGERMALAWMDVARYADTSGLNADGVRQMWPWRI